ncbi:hypothetical protein GT030_21305 [Streptomyces sp. SID1328]|uniref:hypothetical protein n=1 Tax=Streptomyces sp. SID1328 TaxID=2690250 RepID=UPI001369D745|nr:hypothetical protein [Streptomyces sp. SID1328]MYV41330.1 hypothetical protein [Streptomyces sp. SID1328]
MKRGFRGLVTVAVVLAGGGCAADALPARPAGARVAPSERACPHGTFRWGKVVKREVLAGVSDARRFDVRHGATIHATFEAAPLRSLHAGVTPAEDTQDQRAAIAALERKTGVELADAGEDFRLGADRVQEVWFKKSAGVLFYAVGVTTYEASFAHYCVPADTTPTRGTVATWSPVTYGDLVKCGIDEKLEPSSIEAERLVCR